MPSYVLNPTLENIRTITVMFLDIFIIWLILYYSLRIVRNNTRTIQIFKGIILVVALDAFAKIFGLKTLQLLTGFFINWGFLSVIIIFQPEIRSLLERIGKSNVFSRITTLTGNEKEHLVDQIVTAVMLLSKDQTGALISIEQSHSLEDFISTGTRMNSDVSAELLVSLFVTSTPLHDGAVIIQGDKIACASAYFPPTNMELPSRYGARHRAAIGISEITDAVTIIVSEETGTVSITEGGKIFHVDREQLNNYLLRVICGEATEVKRRRQPEMTPAVIVEPEMPEEPRRGSVIGKLAVKKQNIPESGVKAEVEEVIPAAGVRQTSREKNMYAEADREASKAEIKLPHKKDMPKPSYPENRRRSSRQRRKDTPGQKEVRRESSGRDLPKEERRTPKQNNVRPVQEKQPSVVSTPADLPAPRRKKARPNTARMSPEEVRAAREASVKKLTHTQEIPEPIIDLQAVNDEENRMYDTSKLDISKIVGFTNELDREFEMIDSIPSKKKTGASPDRKGGDAS